VTSRSGNKLLEWVSGIQLVLIMDIFKKTHEGMNFLRTTTVKSVSWIAFMLFDVFGVRVILSVKVYEFGCDPCNLTGTQ
jgi:hypothetical protein